MFHGSTPNKRLWVVIGRTFPLQHTFSSIPRTTEWWWWWWLIAISPWGKESAEVRRLSPAKSCFCRWLELCAAVHYVKRRVFRYQFAYRMCPRPGPGWSHSFKWQHSSSEVVLRILAGVFVLSPFLQCRIAIVFSAKRTNHRIVTVNNFDRTLSKEPSIKLDGGHMFVWRHNMHIIQRREFATLVNFWGSQAERQIVNGVKV